MREVEEDCNGLEFDLEACVSCSDPLPIGHESLLCEDCEEEGVTVEETDEDAELESEL